jgi:hypothetical protein
LRGILLIKKENDMKKYWIAIMLAVMCLGGCVHKAHANPIPQNLPPIAVYCDMQNDVVCYIFESFNTACIHFDTKPVCPPQQPKPQM